MSFSRYRSTLSPGSVTDSRPRITRLVRHVASVAAVALVAGVVTAPPTLAASADGDGDGTAGSARIISPELMAALELWQSRTVPRSLGELTAEDHPDVLAMWRDKAAATLGGSLVAHFQQDRPEVIADIQAMLEDPAVEIDDEMLVEYLIDEDPASFAELGSQLSEQGADLPTFVADTAPEVHHQWQEQIEPEPVYQEPFVTFVNDYIDPELTAQAQTYVTQVQNATATMGLPPTTCYCEVVGTSANNPSTQVEDPDYDEERRNNGTWKWYYDIARTKRGAARRVFTDNFKRGKDMSLDIAAFTSSAHIQMGLSCVKDDGLGGMVVCDQGAGCTGEFRVDLRYDSSLWLDIQASSAPLLTKKAAATTMDVARAIRNPNSAAEEILFEKGLALEKAYSSSTNAADLLNGIKGAYNIYQDVDTFVNGQGTGSTSGNVGDFLNELNSDDFDAVLGVVTTTGALGSASQDFIAGFTTTGAAPYPIGHGQNQRVELTGISRAKSNGQGKPVRARTLSANSYYLVGVANNFSCTNAYAPKVSAVWAYDSVWQAPTSLSGLRSSVESFIFGETGLNVDASNRASQYLP